MTKWSKIIVDYRSAKEKQMSVLSNELDPDASLDEAVRRQKEIHKASLAALRKTEQTK